MSDGNKIIPNLDQFLANCHRRKYPAKSTIIYAGDESDALYYILKGSVTVMIEDDDAVTEDDAAIPPPDPDEDITYTKCYHARAFDTLCSV